MKRRSSWLLAVAAAVAATLLAAWVWLARTSSAPEPSTPLSSSTVRPITIAVSDAYAGSCPVLAASDRGFFKAEGLTVTLQPYTSGKLALDAALHGQADLATVAVLPVVLAVMGTEQPVVILANIFRADKDDGIVGRKDRGINTPAELKGKRIGVQFGAANQFVLDAFLSLHRVMARDVTLVDMPTHELAGALANGAVDAVATWEPYLESAKTALGSNGTVFYGDRIYSAFFMLVATRESARAQTEGLQGVLRAVDRGAKYCAENPAEAMTLLKRPENVSVAGLAKLWRGYRFEVSLEQTLLLAMEDQSRWAIQNRLVPGNTVPNYLDHLYFDALNVARPSSITVIH
jgi:NitT/TauT family transport system substrate-binding protein